MLKPIIERTWIDWQVKISVYVAHSMLRDGSQRSSTLGPIYCVTGRATVTDHAATLR